MRKGFSLLLILLWSFNSAAQEATDSSQYSSNTQNKISISIKVDSKDVDIPDSIRIEEIMSKSFMPDSASLEYYKPNSPNIITELNDSLSAFNRLLHIPDSLKLNKQLVEQHLTDSNLKKYLKDIPGNEEIEILSDKEKDFDLLELSEYKAKPESLSWKNQINSSPLKTISEEKILQNTHGILAAQEELLKYKSKYLELPSISINSLDTAVKVNSLEEESFIKRLCFTANLRFPNFSPIVVDFTPGIGFRFNKKLYAGIAYNFQDSYHLEEKFKVNTISRGYQLFGGYTFFKNIFLYTELEFRESPQSIDNLNSPTRIWLIGIGRRVKIKPTLTIYPLLLYNPYYDPSVPSAQRWNLKMGFQIDFKSTLKN